MSKSRVFASVALAGVLVVAGLSAGPAYADDPPLEWSLLSADTVDGVTVTWETASTVNSPFGGETLRAEMPVLRMDVVNNSTETKVLGLGTDFVTKGTVDHLWTAAAWGAFADDISGIESSFWVSLDAGESLSADGGDAATWHNPLPAWSGHTLRVFELSEPPSETVTPAAASISTLVVPGRFVGANLATTTLDNISEIIGRQASVDGGGGSPDLFPGLSATVNATGLTAGENLELWIAPDLDYFFFSLLGGGLPVSAVQIGSGVVAADGVLSATMTLPANLPLGRYQLVAGDSAERYWPAGSYGDFQVTTPTTTQTVASTGAGTVPVTLGPTQVTLTYPAGTSAGSTSVTISGTGPSIDGFQLISDPRLYYHINTTATLGGPATVCISFDPSILSPYPPQLFHFDTALNRWVDITTTRAVGQVCGVTSSFSPFVIGYVEPPKFTFSGFFNPVSMTAENIAKPGQAIPVKFSLHGDQGLDVVTSTRFVTEGNATSLVGEVVDTATAGGSGLTYDSRSDQYTYVWKTPKTLSLKTGRFELTLSDGTVHTFNVTFKK